MFFRYERDGTSVEIEGDTDKADGYLKAFRWILFPPEDDEEEELTDDCDAEFRDLADAYDDQGRWETNGGGGAISQPEVPKDPIDWDDGDLRIGDIVTVARGTHSDSEKVLGLTGVIADFTGAEEQNFWVDFPRQPGIDRPMYWGISEDMLDLVYRPARK
jgi:hypothetical protein